MVYYGNRTMNQQKMTELIVKHLLSEGSFVAKYLEASFEVASYDKIIPQFGADNSYYSVVQYLFNGQNGRTSKLPLVQHLLRQSYKNSQFPGGEFQKRMGHVESDVKFQKRIVLVDRNEAKRAQETPSSAEATLKNRNFQNKTSHEGKNILKEEIL